MKKSAQIQKLSAAFLLLVFAFSLTPKRTLHNAFANHKDTIAKDSFTGRQTPVIKIATINCQCDNLVCESPFTFYAEKIGIKIPFLFQLQLSVAKSDFVSSCLISFGLRGPPSLV